MTEEKSIFEQEWLDSAQVCAKMGISRSTLVRWIQEHQMPCYRVDRKYLFLQDDLERWFRSFKLTDEDRRNIGKEL